MRKSPLNILLSVRYWKLLELIKMWNICRVACPTSASDKVNILCKFVWKYSLQFRNLTIYWTNYLFVILYFSSLLFAQTLVIKITLIFLNIRFDVNVMWFEFLNFVFIKTSPLESSFSFINYYIWNDSSKYI